MLDMTARKYPQSEAGDDEPPIEYPQISLARGDDKADFKATGRLFRIRFSGNSAPSKWRLGRFTFDVKLRGRK
jgi:hypothetical protein